MSETTVTSIYTANKRIFSNQPGRVFMGFASDKIKKEFLSTFTTMRYLKEVLNPLQTSDTVEFSSTVSEINSEGEIISQKIHPDIIFLREEKLSLFKKYAELARFCLNAAKFKLLDSPFTQKLAQALKIRPIETVNETVEKHRQEQVNTLFNGGLLKKEVVQTILNKLSEIEPLKQFKSLLEKANTTKNSSDLDNLQDYLALPSESRTEGTQDIFVESLQNILLNSGNTDYAPLIDFILQLTAGTKTVEGN